MNVAGFVRNRCLSVTFTSRPVSDETSYLLNSVFSRTREHERAQKTTTYVTVLVTLKILSKNSDQSDWLLFRLLI